MSQEKREICCHGFQRPRTEHRLNRYEDSPPSIQLSSRNMASVGLQTESPIPKEFSRGNLRTSLSLESPKLNNFFQRCRSSSRRRDLTLSYNNSNNNNNILSSPVFKSLPLTNLPIYRTGRMGSCWRHMRRVTGPNGENIMYIDGTVKEADCDNFPPHGFPILKLAPNIFLNERCKTALNKCSKSPVNTFSRKICPTSTSFEFKDYVNESPIRPSTRSLSSKSYEEKQADNTRHVHIHLQLCQHDHKRL